MFRFVFSLLKAIIIVSLLLFESLCLVTAICMTVEP